MPLNFRHLRYFIATAETGQVSRAAIDLSISQSAVTAAIKELERVLGAPLFERTQSGMTPTQTGRRFLTSAYEILARMEDALQTAIGDAEAGGALTLAASYTVLGYFLPVHVSRLARAYPSLRLDLHELTRETIEEGLLSNRFDMAVILTSNVANPEIATETLFSSPRRLWAPTGHRLLQQEAVSLKDIAEEDYIMLTVDEAAYTSQRYWARTGLSPRVRLRTSSVEAVRSLVANGQGVTILSDMVYRPWSLEGRRLETMVPSDQIPPMNVGLAWRKGAEFTPQMTLFRDYFRMAFLAPPSG